MEIGFLNLLAVLTSIAVSLAIVVPLSGVLVRFRANYNPKGLQLDAEGGAQPYTGPIVQSYFGMLKRVYTIEVRVISAFMQHIKYSHVEFTRSRDGTLSNCEVPTFLSTIFMTAIILLFIDAPRPTHGKYSAPETGVIGTLVYSVILMFISLPTAIITYRAITTPLKLSWFNAARSLRALLTPTERRRPWILYLTPGLLAAEISHIVIVVLGLGPIRRLLLPSLESGDADISYIKLGIYIVILILSTAVLTPLEVIATRLAIQRNHASSEYNSVSQEIEGDAEDAGEFAGTDEDVIGLRNEEDPYLGLVDCAKRIIDEEGWQALYRAWWITLLGTFGSVVPY
ncbi:hypothetical protein VNI00_003959 [Paramarasmius palmivorus]|uniref:Mitochondrial carrier n=1 Tax=Paramarasmius palmivorus TaxID=297713 RepID=A0AAW0DMV9_9AGAR